MFILAFTTTLREGLEAVIFLAGTTAGGSPESIPIPGIIGLIIGIIVGVLLYYTYAIKHSCHHLNILPAQEPFWQKDDTCAALSTNFSLLCLLATSLANHF